MNIAGVAQEFFTYLGTYTGEKSKGIYLSRFDARTGRLSQPELVAEAKSPTFLALHPRKPLLYAVSEISSFDGKPTGAVSAFRIEATAGRLQLLNQQPSEGKGPCHLGVDPLGKCVLVANYGSGTVAALPIAPDGSLQRAVSSFQHEGSSVNPKRQEGPHAHQAVTSQDGRFAFVCDLGLDQVRVYKCNAAKALLEPNEPPFANVPPGSGPRHLAFAPGGKFAYVINELTSTISAFRYDEKAGALDLLHTVSTLPSGFTNASWCAELEVHPNGRFLYGSNRGHDSIVVFSIEKKTGLLTPIQYISSGGKYPRFFAIDPSGKWLISLNQNSADVAVLSLDPSTGKLAETSSRLKLDSPVCAVFVPAP